MKKNIYSLFIMAIMILCCPYIVFAASDLVVDNNPTIGVKGKSCQPGWTCQYYTGALRFTYVNAKGEPISKSYDFVTHNNQASSFYFVYNNYSGPRSKLKGGFSFATASYANFPKFHEFLASYDKHIAALGHGTKSGINTSKYTGGYSKNGWSTEVNWWKKLTPSSLAPEDYQANVEAFRLAIVDTYGDNLDDVKTKIEEGCKSGEEIFIQMEPLYAVYSYGREVILGSVRDILQYYWNGPKAFTEAQKGGLRNYINKYGFLKAIVYNRDINAPSWTGYEPFYSSYKIADASSMDDPVGYAVGLAWINDSRNGCSECKYEEGKFYYNDEEILPSSVVSPFTNLYEYVLTGSDKGGINCCNALKTAIEGEDASVTDELKEYYDYYCDSGTGDPCTTKESPKSDETIYYCLDGKQCEEEKYKEECGKPECEPDKPEEPDPGNECCTTDPIEQGKIEGEVNNCCADGTESEAHEYDLDELFCNNNYLGVANYQYKCGADFYLEEDTDLDSDYCKMYCTERVNVEIPGVITAISGRYFELETTSKGTKSSYIEGYKRCRVVVNYNTWEQDYYDTVEDQVEAYNQFQKDKANELMYKAANDSKIPNSTSPSTIKCSCEYTAKCADGSNGCKYTEKKEQTCQVKYTKYPFNKMYDIFNVKINEDKRDDCKNKFEAIEIETGSKSKTTHSLWSAWDIDTSACDSMKSSMESSGVKCTLKCTRTTSEAENNKENVPEKQADFAKKAAEDNTAYNSAADIAKELENTIDVCDKYFTDYKGADPEANYKFDAKQAFSYTQIYMDELGKLKLDEIFVDFEESPGCEIDGKVVVGPDSEDKLSAKKYSVNKYGTGSEKMTDFKNMTLEHEKSATGFKKYQDDTYEADKIFTVDAKYHATCSWDEGENNLYTLVPNGSASESTSEMNYTKHGHEYKVYLSTLEGTYETYWDISGLGTPRKGETAGRFDKFFKDAGNTCSNQNPNDKTMLTCKIYSEHEVVLTGYCNGSNETDTTVNPDDCDPYKEGYRLFNFKVVDPKNLFPSGVSTVDGDIGWNWVVADRGKVVMQEIQSTAERGMTYSPDSLSYSYILTPTDMRHIKNYNSQQIEQGGYSDFTLQCSKQSCEAGGCEQCKSPFLENLSSGRVSYLGANHDVTGWGNKRIDLTSVRKSYGWN